MKNEVADEVSRLRERCKHIVALAREMLVARAKEDRAAPPSKAAREAAEKQFLEDLFR